VKARLPGASTTIGFSRVAVRVWLWKRSWFFVFHGNFHLLAIGLLGVGALGIGLLGVGALGIGLLGDGLLGDGLLGDGLLGDGILSDGILSDGLIGDSLLVLGLFGAITKFFLGNWFPRN